MPAPSFPEYYQLDDGRLWDIAAGRFVQMRQTPANILKLPDEASLVDALDQFNLPHGDLEMKSAQAIRAKLKDLDNQYLTPRTLAGLSTSDPYALEQWQIHEQLAQPLRNALAKIDEV